MNRYSYIKENLKKNVTSAEYKMQDAAIAMLLDGEDNISVRTVTERADVERATFYAYYDRVEDIYEAIENEAVEDILKAADEDESIEAFIEHMFSFFAENRKIVKAMVATLNRFSYIEKIMTCIKYYLAAKVLKAYSVENEMLENMISSSITIPLLYYALEERDVDLNRMEEKIRLLLEEN